MRISRLLSDSLHLGRTVLQLLLGVGARRWVVRTCSILVIGIALSNVLLPAVARAQFAAQNGLTIAQIIAALVGQTVTAERYVASASTGSGFACTSQLDSCVDLGPGACNYLGTDASGRVRIGSACAPEVWIGDGTTRMQPGNVQIINGALFVNGTYIQNTSTGAVVIDDADGLNINATTAIKGVVMVAVTVDIGSIAASTCDDVTATVAGVSTNDLVFVTPNFDMAATDISISNARVTNAGTDEVTFRACNIDYDDPQDPDSGSYLFLVMRP